MKTENSDAPTMNAAISIGGPRDGEWFEYRADVKHLIQWRKDVTAASNYDSVYEHRPDLSHKSGREVWLYRDEARR